MIKTKLFKIFILTVIIFSVSVSFLQAQTEQSKKAEAEVVKILNDSGDNFKQGLQSLQDKRRQDARAFFDKSIEAFLYSPIEVIRTQKLSNNVMPKDCYNQLIETIYLIEFPSGQKPPQIKTLSQTCGWTIDNQFAENIAKLSNPVQNNPTNLSDKTPTTLEVQKTSQTDVAQGFSEQRFEPSPLDALSKLELTQDEQQVENNPVAQQQYEYIQYAVANKSLGFTFQVHPMIQQFVNFYRGRGRSTMETGLYRSGMFVRMARRIFREEGVPENVVWLGQVESAWKPVALSWASASGLWQFIPGTGARFGLRRTAYIDERNSFEKATRASAQYLKFLANRYNGNWELALAAYNSGEGNVDRAISRAGVANFWVAYPYLPRETRNYVPNILATILIANNPGQYGFGHVRPAPQLMYDQIRVPASTGLGLIAQSSDTSVEYLRYLNPELRTNTTPPEPYIIRVPAGKVNDVYAVLKKVPASNRNRASVTKVVAGENWQTLSNRTGIPVEQLQAANGMTTAPRGNVVIPNGNNVRKTTYQRPTTPITSPMSGGVRVVRAQSGDTVAKIALRYGASPAAVARFNGLFVDSVLSAGREIKIPSR